MTKLQMVQYVRFLKDTRAGTIFEVKLITKKKKVFKMI